MGFLIKKQQTNRWLCILPHLSMLLLCSKLCLIGGEGHRHVSIRALAGGFFPQPFPPKYAQLVKFGFHDSIPFFPGTISGGEDFQTKILEKSCQPTVGSNFSKTPRQPSD